LDAAAPSRSFAPFPTLEPAISETLPATPSWVLPALILIEPDCPSLVVPAEIVMPPELMPLRASLAELMET
jgi:hypothetical protein